jgi:four helix bundle protein
MIADWVPLIPRRSADCNLNTQSAEGDELMNPDDLKKRSKAFGLKIIRLVESLPRTNSTDVIGHQLMKCGTSVGANYRAACRARSRADFISKMGIVEEESDESIYWLEMLQDSGLVHPDKLKELLSEGNELLSIVVSSINTARRHR